MAIAFIQEFTIVDGDTSTTNYDAVVAKLGLQGAAPQGLLLHSAGFDHDAASSASSLVWETRAESGERFVKEKLKPIIESLATAAAESGEDFVPPTREDWCQAARLDGASLERGESTFSPQTCLKWGTERCGSEGACDPSPAVAPR